MVEKCSIQCQKFKKKIIIFFMQTSFSLRQSSTAFPKQNASDLQTSKANGITPTNSSPALAAPRLQTSDASLFPQSKSSPANIPLSKQGSTHNEARKMPTAVRPLQPQNLTAGSTSNVTTPAVLPSSTTVNNAKQSTDGGILTGISNFFKTSSSTKTVGKSSEAAVVDANVTASAVVTRSDAHILWDAAGELDEQTISSTLLPREDDDEVTSTLKKYIIALQKKEHKASVDYLHETQRSLELENRIASTNEKLEAQQVLLESVQQLHILRPSDELVLHYDPLTASARVVGCPPFIKRTIGRRSKKILQRRMMEQRSQGDSSHEQKQVRWEYSTTNHQKKRKDYRRSSNYDVLSSSSSQSTTSDNSSDSDALVPSPKVGKPKEIIPLGIRCITSCKAPLVSTLLSSNKTLSADQTISRLPTYTNFSTPSFCTYCGCRYARILNTNTNEFILPTYCTKCGRAAPRYLLNDLPPLPGHTTEKGKQVPTSARVNIEGLFRYDPSSMGDLKRADTSSRQMTHISLHTSALSKTDDPNVDRSTVASTEDDDEAKWAETVLGEAAGMKATPSSSLSDVLLAPSALSRYHRHLAAVGRSGLSDNSTQTLISGGIISRATIDAEATAAMNKRILVGEATDTSSSNRQEEALVNDMDSVDPLAPASVASELLAAKEMRLRYDAEIKRIVSATIQVEQQRNAVKNQADKDEIRRLTEQVRDLEIQCKNAAEATEQRIRGEELRLEPLWKQLLATVDGAMDQNIGPTSPNSGSSPSRSLRRK